MRVGAPTAIALEGTGGGLISDNIITDTAASEAIDTAQGGIHILWRSGSKPAQYNRITGNTINGFPISINDDCWGDNASLNTISGNTVDSIYHRGNRQSYHGVIESNYNKSNSHTLVDGTGY